MKRVLLGLVGLIFLLGSLNLASQDNSDQSLILVMYPGPYEWNPVFTYTSGEAQLYTAVYEGLVSYNPRTLQPEPGIASSWSISQDGLEYRFTIRPDAKFFDGRAITSQDVKASWIHMLALGNQSPFGFLLDSIVGAAAYRNGAVRTPVNVGIDTPDSRTLVLRLENPAPHFLSVLAHQSLVVIHPNFLNTESWGTEQRIPSNGPYIVRSQSESRIELEKNPQYWDADNVAIKKISILLRDDPAQNTRDYNIGAVDWILGSFNASELRVPGSFQLAAQFATTYLYFKTVAEPFNDARVRRALTLLLPLEVLRSEDVYWVPTARLIPEIEGYPEPGGIKESSQSEAMELLAQAGYPNGLGLPPIRLLLTESEENRRIASLLKEAWEGKLQTSVETRFEHYQQLYRMQYGNDYDISIMSWIGDYADPLTFLELWKKNNSVNISGFLDADYEKLLFDSALARGEERYALLSQAENLLLSGAALIPLSHSPSVNIIDPTEIGGWYVNALDIHPFKHLHFIGARAPSNVAAF